MQLYMAHLDVMSLIAKSLPQAGLGITTIIAAYGVYKVLRLLYQQWTDPLRFLPGPSNPNFLWGHMKQVYESETPLLHEKWVAEYGPTLIYSAFLGTRRLFTVDIKALNHILMNDYIYQKPQFFRSQISNVVGSNGLLIVEEDRHRQQRRIMNPAFGPAQIREFMDIFLEQSVKLRDIWLTEITQEGGKGRIDALSWLSRMTLDTIGLAGFNYSFNALSNDPEKNELNKAFSTVFKSGTGSFIRILRGVIPALWWLPAKGDAEENAARSTMDRIGKLLLSDSRASINHATDDGKRRWTDDSNGLQNRHLLSLLLRANTRTDLPESQRMSDQDVLEQVPTFLVAGHESTSVATTWALYALTQAPEVQVKLREELLSIPTESPSLDELNALPYLDMVVREILRHHPPLSSTIREALKDDLLPLSQPVKDSNGKIIAEDLMIKKGEIIFIPIMVLNRSKEIWGDDAMEFKPERWENVPQAATTIPGVWGNMLCFLGGPRACIGYRFALAELKTLLFVLVRAFEFELAVPKSEIGSRTLLVRRPVLLSHPEKENQMPLFVTPYVRETFA